MKQISILIILMVISIGLVACGGGNDPIEGKWSTETGTLEFRDGNIYVTDVAFSDDQIGTYENIDDGLYELTVTGEKIQLEVRFDEDKMISNEVGSDSEDVFYRISD